MKEPYNRLYGIAQTETDKAFCMDVLDEDYVGITHKNLWVPKSVVHEDSHDTIEEALRGERVEIFVAKWWLEANL